ncbi:AB-hydrolase YheT [Pholiota conissans]|uniref:AB-hydrolase YheT n=1 Tax=Pholiota conissans TaxID=109636 RepID=A0A9P6D196_9AGAR|nr:AB-hydrolase YheT [Pholiota conissans]
MNYTSPIQLLSVAGLYQGSSSMSALFSLAGLGALAFFITLATQMPVSKHPTIHFAAEPALLPVRKGKGSNEVEHISLRTLLETRCSSLFREFHELWWLSNGHLQTMYCIMGDFSKNDLMWYSRTYLKLADGGTLGLDWAPTDQSTVADDAPIVVVQHGLTGGSYEAYVRAILSRACAPPEKGGLGYRAVVINFRGCAGVPVTSPLLYSAGSTGDTRAAVMYIAHKYPKAPLLGLGFSLGSNLIARYLGEEGIESRIHSACVLACPWDLRQNNYGLLNSFTGKHVYSKALGGNLLNLMKRHLPSLLVDPDHQVAHAAREALKLKNPTLEKFDDTFTRIAGGPAPYWPFPDANAYYVWSSSHTIVHQITVPFLSINAADDPVVRHVPMDGGWNGLVVMGLTKGGGHLGWFQRGSGFVDRWTTKPVMEWLTLMGQDIYHEQKPRGRRIYIDDDGFLREEGTEGLGVKVVEEGVIIDGNRGEDGTTQGL